MGGVWLAERCDGRFEGRAAVKLLGIALLGRAGEAIPARRQFSEGDAPAHRPAH
jgi:hypothetical protein